MKSVISTIFLAGVVRAAPSIINNDVSPYTTPNLLNLIPRTLEIKEKRKGWLYDFSFPFGVAPYPYGTLANKTIEEQTAIWKPWVFELGGIIVNETKEALETIIAKGNFTTLEDYSKLYEGLWQTSLPTGPLPGMLTNSTDDRTFSMMRLSSVPYRLRRVQRQDKLLFPVPANITRSITGATLEELHAQGRLFSEDFLAMKDQQATIAYGAGCQAYFYIDDKTGDFLPLAVKLTVKGREDSALVYTPLDLPDEWLFAKMTINANDGWHSTWGHTTLSHASSEAPFLTAIRSLSANHPVLAMLDRLAYLPWGIRPNLEWSLASGQDEPGPKYYPWTSNAARSWANQAYESGETSDILGNYFHTSLRNRGLIDYPHGPALKHFPFYEDGSVLMEAIGNFMMSFITSYYPTDKAVAGDRELQAWVKEAVPGRVRDFPKAFKTRRDVADILTHQAYLNGIVHTIMSGNGNQHDIMALPFTAAGWQRPIPSEKGVIKDIMEYMPSPEGAVWQVATYAAGNRASWIDTNNTVAYMFDDPAMLSRMNEETRAAAARFKADMFALSDKWRARTFGPDGLDRGMPFVWNCMDPKWAIYWSVV